VLLDFMIATGLAITGVLGLSALTTDTLALNQEVFEYTLARHAANDLAARWSLEEAALPTLPVSDLCNSAATWTAGWCTQTELALGAHLADWQLGGEQDAGDWYWCLHWGEGDCASNRQPFVRMTLQ
jgi:hypothetical protein